MLTVVVVVTACSGRQQATPSGSPAGAPAYQPETAWERALAAVDETGGFALGDALKLFATAFGPLTARQYPTPSAATTTGKSST